MPCIVMGCILARHSTHSVTLPRIWQSHETGMVDCKESTEELKCAINILISLQSELVIFYLISCVLQSKNIIRLTELDNVRF